MSTFQDLCDNVAFVVGGTPPDLANQPGWYSGLTVGDGSGVQGGLVGCYSRPPANLTSGGPIAVVLPGTFTIRRGVPEENIDHLRILVMAETSGEFEWAGINPFRDLIPAALRAKMQLQPAGSVTLSPPVLEAFREITGQPMVHTWGGTEKLGWEFTLTIYRAPIQTYVA